MGGDKCGNRNTNEVTVPGAQARGDRGLGAVEMEKRQQVVIQFQGKAAFQDLLT